MRRQLCCAAIALAVTAGCGTATSDGNDRVTPRASQPATTPPAGMQQAWLRGVGVDAPADWKRDDTHCGTPVSDTLVVNPTGVGTDLCLLSTVAGHSVVWMGTFSRPLPNNAVLGEATIGSDRDLGSYDDATVDGVPVKETTQRTDDGRTLRLVIFPDRDVFVSAASPDASAVDAAVQSLQVTDTDPATSCVVHTTAYDDGQPSAQGDTHELLPGHPASADACVYVSGWLEQTAVVDGNKLSSLVAAAQAAPPTTDQRAPDDTNCESVADMRTPSDDPPMVLHFDYADSSTWTLVAKISWCTRWQSTISSGDVTRRIDQRLILALPQLWTSYPDPDSMDIG